MARARGRNYHGIEERAYRRVEFARLRAAALSGLPGVTILQEYRNLPSAFVRIESEQALDAIVQRPDVEAVHENRKLELFLESSLPFIGQEFIGGIGGAGTTIAFLDTGMSYTNPAFGPCAAPGLPLGTCKAVATAETTFTNDFNEEDDHVFQHRTLVSGIALGVAPEARLAVVDVNDYVYGTQPNFIQNGIDWVIDHAFELNIVAINMSLGDNGAYTSACPGGIDLQIAAYYGIAPIIAAGNSAFLNGSFRDGIAWPACVDYAISVGAVWESDMGSSGPLRASPYTCTDATTAPDQVACFSQTSPVLSFLAPGIFVTAAGITNSGTSMAAPHVAGAWAVVRSGNPDPTMEEVLAKLQAEAEPVTDTRIPGGRTVARIEFDRDNDNVPFPFDNCTAIANTSQRDADGDGCGNRCDADFNNSGNTTILDFTIFDDCFGKPAGQSAPDNPLHDPLCEESDMNDSGVITIVDFADFKAEFASPSTPGPSGLPVAQPNTTCTP